jgi:hypothetical protein
LETEGRSARTGSSTRWSSPPPARSAASTSRSLSAKRSRWRPAIARRSAGPETRSCTVASRGARSTCPESATTASPSRRGSTVPRASWWRAREGSRRRGSQREPRSEAASSSAASQPGSSPRADQGIEARRAWSARTRRGGGGPAPGRRPAAGGGGRAGSGGGGCGRGPTQPSPRRSAADASMASRRPGTSATSRSRSSEV